MSDKGNASVVQYQMIDDSGNIILLTGFESGNNAVIISTTKNVDSSGDKRESYLPFKIGHRYTEQELITFATDYSYDLDKLEGDDVTSLYVTSSSSE